MARLLPALRGKAGKPDAGSPPVCQEAWTAHSPSKMRASSVVTDSDVSDLGLTSEDLKSFQPGKLSMPTTGRPQARRRASEPIHGDGTQSWHLGLPIPPPRLRRPSASSSPRKRPSVLPLAPTGGNRENSANNASDSEDYELPPNVKSARGRPTQFSETQSWQLGEGKSDSHRTRPSKSIGCRTPRTQSQEIPSPSSTKASTPRQEAKAENLPLPLLDQRPPLMAPKKFLLCGGLNGRCDGQHPR